MELLGGAKGKLRHGATCKAALRPLVSTDLQGEPNPGPTELSQASIAQFSCASPMATSPLVQQPKKVNAAGTLLVKEH